MRERGGGGGAGDIDVVMVKGEEVVQGTLHHSYKMLSKRYLGNKMWRRRWTRGISSGGGGRERESLISPCTKRMSLHRNKKLEKSLLLPLHLSLPFPLLSLLFLLLLRVSSCGGRGLGKGGGRRSTTHRRRRWRWGTPIQQCFQ